MSDTATLALPKSAAAKPVASPRATRKRLLTWLGKHGEAIWDSEPASFSVNLSIGAIEDETFPQRIEQWLAQYSIPAEYIGFDLKTYA